MIAYKTLTAVGSATNTFGEEVLGASGGQPDWTAYIISTTNAAVTITLPAASKCEGRVVQFICRNPNSKTITINPASSSDTFIITQTADTSLVSTVPFCQVNLFCDGTSWWVLEGGSFV